MKYIKLASLALMLYVLVQFGFALIAKQPIEAIQYGFGTVGMLVVTAFLSCFGTPNPSLSKY